MALAQNTTTFCLSSYAISHDISSFPTPVKRALTVAFQLLSEGNSRVPRLTDLHKGRVVLFISDIQDSDVTSIINPVPSPIDLSVICRPKACPTYPWLFVT